MSQPSPGAAPDNPAAEAAELSRADSAFVRAFPCTGCGAKLTFAPGTRELRCEHCGTANSFAENDARIEELDFESWLADLEGHLESDVVDEVTCGACGAQQTLGGATFSGHCGFCGTAIVAKSVAERRIRPQSVVPFEVDRRAAQERFREWVKSLWFAPGDLKRYAQSDAGLTGLYLPYWTYDCNTASEYRGERGDDYTTTETYSTTDSSGNSVTKTRDVTRTRWSPKSGHVSAFHDDVLVMASKSLPKNIAGSVMQFNLSGLVPYQAEYLGGYRAEIYQVSLREGFPIARQTIDATVEGLIRRDIGGDRQRIHGVNTNYTEVKFKHVLLPAWVSAYRYRDKAYRFVINGQTGAVTGERPWSWWKIGAAVLAALILLVVLSSLGEG